MFKLCLKPLSKFIETYFIKGGFLDGMAGFVVSDDDIPADCAGVGIEGEEMGVDGTDVDEIAEDSDAAVDLAAADANVIGHGTAITP